MFDFNVFVYWPEDENLSFNMICNREELKELSKCYDKNDLNVKKRFQTQDYQKVCELAFDHIAENGIYKR